MGSDVYYWSATEYSANDSRYFNINNVYTNSYTYQNSKSYGQSVRCVKGDPSTAPVRPSSSSSADETKSSSSSAKSSSSSAKSSSSYSDGWSWDVPKEARLNPNIKYDSMIDPRDKKVYKVVKIDVEDENYSQVWMAENLNYADSNRTPSLKGGNWCYNNEEKNCKVSGRYYSWAAAIDSVALANDSKEPLVCGYGKKCGLDRAVQGICPDGWHLPSIYEWGLLSVALGGAPVSGKPLKALTGWNYSSTGYNNGTDLYGFAARPTGRRISATSWEKVGSDVYYWSATEQNADYGRYFNINNVYTNSYTSQDYKSYGQSVRCVKGDPSTAPVRPSSSSSVDKAKSSSSSTKSSSSAVVSSSSVILSSSEGFSNNTKDTYLNPNINYGEMTDSRDGQVYKTVKIGNQTWMAQNLNYADSVKTPSLVGRTGCYVVDDPDCKWSGRGYSWAAAIDSMALANDSVNPVMCGYNRSCSFTSQVRGICPEGWHLPDTTEWNNLFAAVGGREVAGLHLKAKMGWHGDSNGVDDFGFSAIATDFSVDVYGDRVYGHHTNFWSSVENGLAKSATAYLGAASEAASISAESPKYAGSTLNGQRYAGYMIRCLKD